MTPRERAIKLAKDMVYAYEVCATMKDLDNAVHAWSRLGERAITAAVEEEREACARIADEVKVENWSWTYSAHGGANLIAERIRARCNKSATESNNTYSKMR